MSGFENLSGQTRGTLFIETGPVSRQPLKWSVHCVRCGSSFQLPHSQLQQSVAPSCRNSACGRTAEPSRSAARVDSIPLAVRSRDSDDARRYAEQQRPREITMPVLSEADMLAMDSDTLARHIEYERKRNVRSR